MMNWRLTQSPLKMFELEAILTSTYAPIIAGLFAGLCATVYWNSTKRHRFWYNQGLKGEWLPPYVGPLYKMLTVDRLDAEHELGKKYGKIYIETNLSGDPRLVVADPEVIRQILIKDFDHFTDHYGIPYANKYQKNFLVWLKGDHWKRVRSLMSPSFTSGKIKRMFKLFSICADDLVENFREQSRDSMAIVNLHDIYSLYTIDGITTCGYGIKLERKQGDLDARIAAGRDHLIEDVMRVVRPSPWRIACTMVLPRFLLNLINFKLNPEVEFEPLIKRLEELIKRRQKQPQLSQKQDDILQLLIDAEINDEVELGELDQLENHHANLTHESLVGDQRILVDSVMKAPSLSDKVKLSNLEMISEALLVLLAGLETSRTLLANCSYALAYNQHVQEKLVKELQAIANSGCASGGRKHDFSYEDITSCHYLDAVISETLRMLPPALRTARVARENYIIEKYNVHVPAGSHVFAGTYVVQNNPEFWENPHEFNPERFMPENRHKIVPGSYLPFGMGPRHCIGMRFTLTETKIGLAKVLMNFRFEPAPGLKFPPKSAVGITLNVMRNPYVKILPR